MSFLIAYGILNDNFDCSIDVVKRLLDNQYIVKFRELFWRCKQLKEHEVRIRQEFKIAFKNKLPISCNGDGLIEMLNKCFDSNNFVRYVFLTGPDEQFLNVVEMDKEEQVTDKNGKKKKTILDLLNPHWFSEESKLQLIEELKKITGSSKGIDFAKIILIAVENNVFIKKPSFELLVAAGFEDFGARSGYNEAYKKQKGYYKKDIGTDSFMRLNDDIINVSSI